MAIDNTAGQISGIPTPEQIAQARDILSMARFIRRNKARGYNTATLEAALRTMVEIYHDLGGDVETIANDGTISRHLTYSPAWATVWPIV